MKQVLIILSAMFCFILHSYSQAMDTLYFRDAPQQPILATAIRFDSDLIYYQQKDNLGTEQVVQKSNVIKVCYWDKSIKYFMDEKYSVVIDTLTKNDRKMLYNAGIHLKKYSQLTYIGFGTALIGGITSGIGFGIKDNTVGYIGLGIAGAGVIFSLIPPIQIAKAGNFLIKFGIQ
jgi:hypothetical protein